MADSPHSSVIDLERLRRVEAEFSDATALGIITVDCRGIPTTPACGFSQFCLAIRQDPVRRLRCFACDAHGGLQAAIEGRPRIYRCHTGLVDFSIPITHENQYVGAILCGQARLADAPGESDYLLGHDDSWRDDAHLRDLYEAVPLTTSDKIQSAANMLATLTQSMVHQATARTTLPVSGYSPTTRPLPADNTQPGQPPAELVDLRLAVENEDLPAAVAALTRHLDRVFADSGRYIGADRVEPVEDELLGLANAVGQTVGDAITQVVHRRRSRHPVHLNRYTCQNYLESLLHNVVNGAVRFHAPRQRSVATLLNRIESDPTRAWTLKEAATYLGLSFSHASKRFKAVTGQNFVSYVSDKRIDRAKLMLRYTDMTVLQVAREVNYLPNYFSRVFKLTSGLTPTQYRQRYAPDVE